MPHACVVVAGQQMFINNTFQYAIGDFPLSKKDYEAAFRHVSLPIRPELAAFRMQQYVHVCPNPTRKHTFKDTHSLCCLFGYRVVCGQP